MEELMVGRSGRPDSRADPDAAVRHGRSLVGAGHLAVRYPRQYRGAIRRDGHSRVIQAIGQYLPKPVLVGPIQPVRVTLQTPGPVDRVTLLALLRGLVNRRISNS